MARFDVANTIWIFLKWLNKLIIEYLFKNI